MMKTKQQFVLRNKQGFYFGMKGLDNVYSKDISRATVYVLGEDNPNVKLKFQNAVCKIWGIEPSFEAVLIQH